VERMLAAAAQDREVTRETMLAYRHEAAVTYLDMTPLLLIAVAVFMALRYIGRGAGLQELMVLAGVGLQPVLDRGILRQADGEGVMRALRGQGAPNLAQDGLYP